MTATHKISDHLADHEVYRDNQFSSYQADLAVALRSPKNIDLSFVKIETIFETCKVEQGSEMPTSFNTRPNVREIARVTVAPSTAASLAMDILDEIAGQGILDYERTSKKLHEIMEKIKASDEDSED